MLTVDKSDEGYWVITARDDDGMPFDQVGEFATEAEAKNYLADDRIFIKGTNVVMKLGSTE